MYRYQVSQFDGSTFVVIDVLKNNEICVCSNFDEVNDAEVSAKQIAAALNQVEKNID